MRPGHSSPGRYEIRVQGRLEARWATWFDGFTLACDADGTTVLSGTVVDQSALHGLLRSLGDLGLPLVSVTQRRDETDESLPTDDRVKDAAKTPATPTPKEPR